jgi:hypothetical protein
MPPETLGQHRHLRGHAGADRCCGKSLIGSALVRFSVRQHARGESISKRAPSTTRTSLRVFGISGLRASGSARNPNCHRNCDTPPNVLRSLAVTPTGAKHSKGHADLESHSDHHVLGHGRTNPTSILPAQPRIAPRRSPMTSQPGGRRSTSEWPDSTQRDLDYPIRPIPGRAPR